MSSICREEFDEEKEPDGMVLSGWTQAPPPARKEEEKAPNGNNKPNTSLTEPVNADSDDDLEMFTTKPEPVAKKRKHLDESKDEEALHELADGNLDAKKTKMV